MADVELLQQINCEEFLIDASYDMCPRDPQKLRLMTIMGCIHNTVINYSIIIFTYVCEFRLFFSITSVFSPTYFLILFRYLSLMPFVHLICNYFFPFFSPPSISSIPLDSTRLSHCTCLPSFQLFSFFFLRTFYRLIALYLIFFFSF